MNKPDKCPCGSGNRPWWRDDWRAAERGEPTTTWVCEACSSKEEEPPLIRGARYALVHLQLCDCREESANDFGSRAERLLKQGLGIRAKEKAATKKGRWSI
jgi:hypothetical protein